MDNMMIGFQLGREFKLSIAEILAVFPEGKTVYFDKDILILDGLSIDFVLEKANSLGGSIKILDFKKITTSEINNYIVEEAEKKDGKFNYGVSIFGKDGNLKTFLLALKKDLKKNNISSRFVNKDFKNLSSAQIIGEKLVKKESDFNIVFPQNPSPTHTASVLTPGHLSLDQRSIYLDPLTSKEDDNKVFIGSTIWVQDIKSYSDRDYSKERDMQVGMLPPKLSQMMINLSGGRVVYDPFIGLGTILIESVYMGNTKVYGTDLSDKMVESSNENLKELKKKFDFNYDISKLNAKFIEESEFLSKADVIVSEGYLGEVMTKNNISVDRIERQRVSLVKIYEAFFSGLKKVKFTGNIVISFPFWEIKGKYFYFEEIYNILDKYCNIKSLLPGNIDLKVTKSGSLLYKRPAQLVGREIFKLTIK